MRLSPARLLCEQYILLNINKEVNPRNKASSEQILHVILSNTKYIVETFTFELYCVQITKLKKYFLLLPDHHKMLH